MLISPTLESATDDCAASRERFAALPDDLLAPGDVVAGCYEVRGKIGEGGMGQVYDAWDRALGRGVAIKIAAPNGRISLGNEARALAALRHPSIVAVYAFGEHAGKAYLVMERVAGKTLHHRLCDLAARQERLTIAEVVDLLAGIADALAVVHAAGMAHRDVKPSNVLLAPGDRVVLADFGVFQPEIAVRAFRGGGGGTPHYMAPEALTESVDPGLLHLVDVYALGVVAYELLTGAVPYDDPDVLKILSKQVHDPVPDPAVARRDVPPSLAALVRAMLAKEPLDRPRGMDEVAGLLRRIRARLEPPPRCSVLVVEDNEATATLITSMVSAHSDGVAVHVARDAREAIEAMRTEPADLVIVDLHLPAMTGVELCRRLRDMRVSDGTLIVAMSSHASDRELEAVRALGVVQYMPKGEMLAGNLPALVHAAVQRARARTHRPPPSTPAATARPDRADRASLPVRRPRVLFVEDHDDTRDIYAWCMRAAGWEVDAVARGLEAVAVVAMFQPDVVVMDLHMPDMSGIEAARRLKEDRRTAHVPVVACTAYGRQHEGQLRESGFRFVLHKPCEPEDLRTVLEGLVPGAAA